MTSVIAEDPQSSLANDGAEEHAAPVAVVVPTAPLIRRQTEAYHFPAMVISRRGLAVDAVGRLASLGALGFSIALPLVNLLLYATVRPYSHRFLEALVATSIYLPLQVRHVWHGLKGGRPRGLTLSLFVMAVAIVAPTPTLGVYWLYSFHALAASVLVTTRPRISFPLLVGILATAGIWGNHFGGALGRAEYVYLPAAVLDRAMTIFILVWLVGALRRIQLARVALAEQALETERQSADAELTATVGAQLEEVVRRGEAAFEASTARAPNAELELESLITGARAALSEARRLIGRYKTVSARAELEKAALVLQAAGIEVGVEMPDDTTIGTLDESSRAELRAQVGQLLTDGAASAVILRLEPGEGSYRLEARSVPAMEPTA